VRAAHGRTAKWQRRGDTARRRGVEQCHDASPRASRAGRTNFGLLKYGIATARRAWLSAEQAANTRPWPEFATLRKRAR
jgi:hypothetical protein